MITKAKFITNEEELKQGETFGQTVKPEHGWFEFGFDIREVVSYNVVSDSTINIFFRTGLRFAIQNNDGMLEQLRMQFINPS